MKKIYFALFLLASISIQAQVTVASIFADNMVLQRHVKIPVWGWADANEKIIVKFHSQSKTTKADKNGKWFVHLDSEIAGGPYILSIKGKNQIQIKKCACW